MNKIIAALAIIASTTIATTAHAEAKYWSRMSDGYILVLGDDEGDCNLGKRALLVAPHKSMRSMEGCWNYRYDMPEDKSVQVTFVDGDTYFYDPAGFTIVEQKKAKGRRL